jgi:hypothetical protein
LQNFCSYISSDSHIRYYALLQFVNAIFISEGTRAVRIFRGNNEMSTILPFVLFSFNRIFNNRHFQVVVLNSATNFILTGLFGQVFFSEIVSRYWWLGFGLISIGIALITASGQAKSSIKNEDSDVLSKEDAKS